MNTVIKLLMVLSAISFNPLVIASTLNVDGQPQVITLKAVDCELNKDASYNEHPGKIAYHRVIGKEHAEKICDGSLSSLTSIEFSVNKGGSEPSLVGVWEVSQLHDYVRVSSFRWVNSEKIETGKRHDEYKTGFSLRVYGSENNGAISIGYELAETYDAERWKDSLLDVNFFTLHSFVSKGKSKFNRGECLLFWGVVNPSSETRRFFSICES
ncbi:hypothetical protein [Pectobacterium sp. B2J-2]|uniref:hypothetical protein n=1 Tax=Pectobacterium sp. B2J-2 TaxID=3385372 RepID=UPI0038FCE862